MAITRETYDSFGGFSVENTTVINDTKDFLNINSLQIKNQLIKYSYKFYKKRMSYSEYLKNFHILSLQRNLKILGIFTRLFVRDGKPDYFNFMPNTWNLIALRLRNPYLKTIASLLNKFVNKKTRRKIFK